MKSGYGSMQGSFNFEGTWERDKPIKAVEKI